MKKFVYFLTFLVLALGIAGAAYILNFYQPPLYVEDSFGGDARFWEKILTLEEEAEAFDEEPFGVIIPHHLIAADKTAEFYANLAETIDPSMIVIIGPNHFQTLPSVDIQTCERCVYQTSMGEVNVDQAFVQKLAMETEAQIQDETFFQEHAIFAHSPFVKKSFPETSIVPILMQWDTDPETATDLARWLNDNLPEDALVIASIDFSHYIPANAADFHDYSSYATIENFDYENVYDLEIDARSVLYSTMKLMEMRQNLEVERVFHTSNQDYFSDILRETTSHQYITFSPGILEQYQGVSMMTFGNMPADAELGLIDGWQWDPAYDQAADQSVTRYLRDVRSQEDRFLVGADFLVFDLEEGCETREQNFMEVDFCMFDEEGEFSEQLEMLLESEADLIYVMYESQDADQYTLETFADYGADIVMVKPAGLYLDIIRDVREATRKPVAAYQISGEYAQIHAAARLGWLDLARCRHESLLAIKRAGADMILTYFAKDACRWLA